MASLCISPVVWMFAEAHVELGAPAAKGTGDPRVCGSTPAVCTGHAWLDQEAPSKLRYVLRIQGTSPPLITNT